MARRESFQVAKSSLIRQHIGNLDGRASALSARVERGRYDDKDLVELAYILESIRNDLVGNDTRLSEAIGIPGKTIAATYSGRSRPKYTNFMKMLYGARQILAGLSQRNKADVDFDVSRSDEESATDDGGVAPVTEPVRIRSHRTNIFLTERDLSLVQAISKASNKQISTVIGEALKQYAEGTASSSNSRERRRGGGDGITLLIKNRGDIIRYSTAIIVALEEALDYDPIRHHNRPPPDLRVEESEYLDETRKLVAELKALNAFLAKLSRSNLKAAKGKVSRIGKHFDKFFSSYATTLGKGAAGLTIAAAAALLYQAGVSTEIVDSIWRHWKRG